MPAQDITIVLRVDDRGTRVIKQFSTNLRTGLKDAEKGATGASGSFSRLKESAKGAFTMFASGMLPVMGIMGAISALRRTIADTINTGREFEKQFANVTTLIDLNTEQTEAFRRGLLNLSPTLGKVTELTKGMYQAVSAGVEAGAPALEFMKVAAMSAQAGLADMDSTVRALASTMNAYGMSTATAADAVKNVTDISDILFVTIKKGITTMPQLVGALSQVTATAAATRVPFEQIGAAIATLTKKGLSTRQAVLGLNRTLMGFLKPTAEVRKAARELGIQFDATKLASEGIPGIIKLIKDRMVDAAPAVEQMTKAGASQAEIFQEVARITGMNVTALTKLFPSVTALRTVLMLTSDSGKEFNSILEEMKNRAGATEEAFRKQTQTADFWLKTLGATFERMKIGFWEGITKPFKDSIKSTDDFKKKFEAWAKGAIEKATKFGETLGKIGKFLYDHRTLIGAIIKTYGAWYVLQKKMLMLKLWTALASGVGKFQSGASVATGALKSLTAQINLAKMSMGQFALVASSAFVGWKIGEAIGKINLFGKTLNERIQETYMLIPGIGEKMIAAEVGFRKSTEGMTAALGRLRAAQESVADFMEKEFKVRTTEIEQVVGRLGERVLRLGATGNEFATKWVKSWIAAQAGMMGVEVHLDTFEQDIAKMAQTAPMAFAALIGKIRALNPELKKTSESTEGAAAAVEAFSKEVLKFASSAGVESFAALEAKAKDVEAAIRYAKTQGIGWSDAVKLMSGKIVDLGDKIIPVVQAMGRKLPEGFMKAYDAAKKYEESMKEASKATEKHAGSLNVWQMAAKEVAKTVTLLRDQADSLGVTLKSDLEQKLKEVETAFESLSKKGQLTGKAQSAAVEGIIEMYRKLGKEVPLKYQVLSAMSKRTTLEIVADTEKIGISWEEVNKEIQADWIRNIAELIKGGGSLLGALKGIFSNILDVWVDKTAQMITEGQDVWGSLKAGFEGMSKSVGGVFKGIGGAVGKLVPGVGNLITKFAGLAGPIGAAISIGSRLPVIGDFINGITNKVTGLLSKIPLIGKLFKKQETEAERQARLMKEWVGGLTKDFQGWGQMSEATAEIIAKDVVEKGMKGYIAVSSHFARVIEDVGVKQENINKLWKRATDILGHFESGELDAAVAAEQAGQSFLKLVEGAERLGQEGSAAMIEFIRHVKRSGLEVQEVTDYINEQLGVTKSSSMNAAQGLEAMARAIPIGPIEQMKERQAELLKQLESTAKGTQEYETLSKAAEDLSKKIETASRSAGEQTEMLERQALAVFNAMVANGASYEEAMNSIGGTLDALAAAHETLGTDASGAIATLLKIRKVTESHRELFGAIEGNLAVLNALGNTGSLNQQVLDDAAKSAQGYYEQLKEAGLNGNQALKQMAPTLERLQFFAEQYGLKLDDSTQALIDQATQAGFLEEKQESLAETMKGGFEEVVGAIHDLVDVMKGRDGLRGALERDIPEAADSAAGKIRSSLSGAFDAAKSAASAAAGDIQGYFKKNPITWPVNLKTGGAQPTGGQGPTTRAQTGFHDVVTGPHTFYVEPGKTERVDISPVGAGAAVSNTDKLLAQLIEVVRSQEGGSTVLDIQPIVIPKEHEYVVRLVTKKLQRGDIRVPTTAVRGT